MNSSTLPARAGFVLALALASAELSFGQTTMTDTFDSNVNWWQSGVSGNGRVAVHNGTLEYTVTTATANDGAGAIAANAANFATWDPFSPASHQLVGDIATDWWAQVDVHLSTAAVGAGVGFHVVTLQDKPWRDGLMTLAWSSPLDSSGDPFLVAGTGTYSGHWTGAVGTGLLENYTFKFSYTAASHTLVGAIYDGETLLIATSPFDVTSPSGTGDTNGLGLSADFAGPAFGFMLQANSKDAVIGSGEVYFDNFSYSGLVDSPYVMTAVPEPSTYAAWAGLAVIGAVALARRRARQRDGRAALPKSA